MNVKKTITKLIERNSRLGIGRQSTAADAASAAATRQKTNEGRIFFASKNKQKKTFYC